MSNMEEWGSGYETPMLDWRHEKQRNEQNLPKLHLEPILPMKLQTRQQICRENTTARGAVVEQVRKMHLPRLKIFEN